MDRVQEGDKARARRRTIRRLHRRAEDRIRKFPRRRIHDTVRRNRPDRGQFRDIGRTEATDRFCLEP